MIACVPQLSAKVITPCDSQASIFLHRTLCPQRTGLASTHLGQQVSISHGRWSLGPDTIPRYYRAIDRLITQYGSNFP